MKTLTKKNIDMYQKNYKHRKKNIYLDKDVEINRKRVKEKMYLYIDTTKTSLQYILCLNKLQMSNTDLHFQAPLFHNRNFLFNI